MNTIADAIQSPEPYGAEDICGQVTGDIQAGVAINISKLTCGTNQALTPVVTDAEGNFCFRNLQTGVYRISDPQGVSCAISCAISPFQYGIIIPQTGPISYNFTATCP